MYTFSKSPRRGHEWTTRGPVEFEAQGMPLLAPDPEDNPEDLQRIRDYALASMLEPNLDEETIKSMKNHKFPPTIVSLMDVFKIFDPHCQNILDSKLLVCSTDEQKLEVYQEFFHMTALKRHELKNTTKYESWAEKFRLKGTAEYKKKDWTRALRYYNLGLMFAPHDCEQKLSRGQSPEIAIGFANRASVLLEFHELDAALEDVKRALKYGYADKGKMEARKRKCIQMKVDMAKFAQTNQHLIDEQKRRLDYRQNFIFKLKHPGTELPMAEDFVKILGGDEEGQARTVVVTRDVPAGTVLIVEEPFVTGMIEVFGWDVSHCHYCLQITMNPIPCKKCVFTVYCNETCADKAFKEYHRYECAVLPNLAVMDTPIYVLTAFKSVLSIGPKALYEIFKTQSSAYFEKKVYQYRQYGGREQEHERGRSLLCSRPTWLKSFSSSSYLSYFHLMTHSDEESCFTMDDLQFNYLRCIQFVQTLISCGDFFNQIQYTDDKTNGIQPFFPLKKQCERKRFENFIMALCIRHVKAVFVNGLIVQETSGWETVSLRRIGSNSNESQITSNRNLHDYATGVYNFGSVLNHSCDPTARRVSDLSKGKHSVISIRPLRPGDEITISYGCDFLNDEFSSRQIRLGSFYNFTCHCVACTKDWPVLKGWVARTYRGRADFKCQTVACTGILTKQGKKEEKSPKKKCGKVKVKGQDVDIGDTPKPRLWECKTCGKTVQMEKILEQWKILFNNYHEVANPFFTRNQPLEALQFLKDFLDFAHANVTYPYPEMGYASDTLIRCMHLIIYFSEGKYF